MTNSLICRHACKGSCLFIIAVPVTMTWRDELERKAQNAVMRAMGQSPTFRGGLDHPAELRKGSNQFEDLCDEKVTSGLSY